jgi:hypothetical protein
MTNSWNDPDEPTRVYDPTRSNSLPPPDEPWFISRDSRGKEQLSAGQIIELCQDGTLSESTLVWRDGLTGWTALGEVPELAQALRAFSKLPPVPRQDEPLHGPLPSIPVGRPSLPSLPPPPSLVAPAGRRLTSTTTPPQRVGRTPSIIINERAPMLATPMPTGRALSLLTVSEPYSLRIPGSKRVGVWSLAAGIAALVFGVGLGAFVFAGDEESDAVARALNLDQSAQAATGHPTPGAATAGSAALGASPAGDEDGPERVVQVTESEDPPAVASAMDKESAPVAPEVAKSGPRPRAGGGGSSSPAFDKAAANEALTAAAAKAARCKPAGGPTGSGQVRVTYGPTGAVKSATVLTPRFKGTSTASCVQMVFRAAKVPAFGGADTSLTRSFTIQ